MLLQFNVKNFKSIKDEVVLTTFANNKRDHSENIATVGKDRVLTSLAIFGANAAGKTNLFKALTCAIMLVRRSNSMQVNDITGVEPFLFEKDIEEKSKFDFLFLHNGKKYAYGFVADSKNIYEEYLYEYKSAKPTTIFERTNINEYKFTTIYKELSDYVEKNTPNKLFLSTATAWNCEATKDAYLWFSEGIDTYNRLSIENGQYLGYLDDNKDDPRTKSFLLSMLKHAEINIDDYNFETKEVEGSSIPLPPGMTIDYSKIGPVKQFELEAIHNIRNEDGVLRRFTLPFESESDGTKLLFAYGPIIKKALETGRTIVVDELDNSLHRSLCKYLIDMFRDPDINPNGAQLIFNSHDLTLMDLDVFRRDQIYFVEKENETGVTEMYSLADFSPRKTENVQKGYMQGRYGAIPFVVGGVEW